MSLKYTFSIVSLKMSHYGNIFFAVHSLNYAANMLVLILMHFSSSPQTFVLLEVTFLANQINVCGDKMSFIRPPLLCDSLRLSSALISALHGYV